MIHTVSILEDEKPYARLLKGIIDNSRLFSCPAIYHDPASLLNGFASHPSDLILMDTIFSTGNGINICQFFRKHHPQTILVQHTTVENDDQAFAAMRAGADGYQIRINNPEQIIHHLQEALQNRESMCIQIGRKIVVSFTRPVKSKIRLQELTPKENEVLTLLAKGAYYKEIAVHMQVELDTVKKYCSRIYRKLNVSNRTEASNLLLGR